MYQPIDRSFFEVPVLELSRKLIGQYIVHEQPPGSSVPYLVARIVETEAYQGPIDRAAHSFSNQPTKRTEVMFKESGLVYTYQMHTHTLMNVVSGAVGIPHAVLIRAAEPIEGLEQMQENRGEKFQLKDWTNGPGKLTKALGITMKYYGHHWSEKPLFISEGPEVKDIEIGPRVGIGNSGEAADYPWRFFEKGSKYVSKYR